MNLHQMLSDSITAACHDVFSTMMGVEITRGEVSLDTAAPSAEDGVVSFIGLAGTWAGTGSLACSPAFACRICSQLLLTDVQGVNEDVLDAVAEITNMIIGGVKTDLEQHLGPLGLSIPTVVYGHKFKTRSMGAAHWTTVRFLWDETVLVIRLTLAPVAHTTGLHLPDTHGCSLEI